MANEPKKIVIVEDEPDTAEMFAEMMRLSSFTVLKSYGGTAAIALISHVKPDAVVLDVMMPDLSGLEVLRFMRSDPSLAHIPVIVVSAKSLPSDIKEGLEAGASIYLTKPVAYQTLTEAVRNTIQAAEADR
ncbi:MAG: response regulator [Chloroflexi bacterium]|nr:response regulator [Chloroflexota bacterium]MBU1661127.1 response regulator [Chloroflexota bacterium]